MPQDSNYPSSCWRFEYIDGGGPWFKPDGTPRDPNNVPAPEERKGVLYGCDTIQNLQKYMKDRDVDTTFMLLAHYRDIEVLDYDRDSGHLVFVEKSPAIKRGMRRLTPIID